MNPDENEQKKFLEDQLEWCKEKICILVEIDRVLFEMKAIAEYALQIEHTTDKINELNCQLNELKNRVNFLEHQLYVERMKN